MSKHSHRFLMNVLGLVCLLGCGRSPAAAQGAEPPSPDEDGDAVLSEFDAEDAVDAATDGGAHDVASTADALDVLPDSDAVALDGFDADAVDASGVSGTDASAIDAGCGAGQPCEPGLQCGPGGACLPEPCSATEPTCTGNAVKACVDGKANVSNCPGPCAAGACCAPGPAVCQGTLVMQSWCTKELIPGEDCAGKGLLCWQGQCAGSECAPGGIVPCDDGNPCTDDACQGGACKHTPSGGPCSDGSACTVGDACAGGVCFSGAPAFCDDQEPCTLDKCDVKVGCKHVPISATCSDDDVCTLGDVCVGGKCEGQLLDADGDGFSPLACGANDCDDTNALVHPGAPESCTPTGLDYDCDGETDESCVATNAVGCGQEGDPCGVKGTCQSGHCLWTDGSGYSWTLVPAGKFWMGCDKGEDPHCVVGLESPRHLVETSGYWIGVDEATVSQYAACEAAGACSALGSYAGCTIAPMAARNCLKWAQARAFCQWLGGDLPSEAWWEKAARGGCEQYPGQGCANAEPIYPWGNTDPVCGQQAVVLFPGPPGCGGMPQDVGSGSAKGVSPYGARDMAGNVDEWVLDFEDWDFYGKPEATAKDPVQLTSAYLQVTRGGSWSGWAATVRAASRGHGLPGQAYLTTGMRCVRPAP